MPADTVPGTFRFVHDVDVRFKDIDVGGHAHHSHALVYFEEARAGYWREVVGRTGIGDVDYILAEAVVRYRQRVFWPQQLSVAVRVSRLGKKHFEMAYEVRGDADDVLITGTTVQIMYDYDRECTMTIPKAARAAIDAHDGPFGRGGHPD